MAKAMDEMEEALRGRSGMGRHRFRRTASGAIVPSVFDDEEETDRERATRRRACHGPLKRDCVECSAYDVEMALKRVRAR